MKASVRVLLAALLAVFLAGGSYAYLRYSPHGELNPSRPGETVQAYLSQTGEAGLRQLFLEQYRPEVTPFESAEDVANAVFKAASGEGFVFRRDPAISTGKMPAYLVSRGDTDLFRVTLTYQDGAWQQQSTEVLPVAAQSRAVRLLVPADAGVSINGRPVEDAYISASGLLYDDLSALEQRFSSVPCRTEYTVPGLYLRPDILVEREGGVLLTEFSSDEQGSFRAYTVPDAAGHAFRLSVPADASVVVCGAELTEENLAATLPYATKLSIPEEWVSALPSCRIYEAGGLYSEPDIRVTAADGSLLFPAEKPDGTLVYSVPGDEQLYQNFHARVEEYLTANCHYGAGHTGAYYPAGFCVTYSDIWNYYTKATYSLIWVQGVRLTIHSVTSSDYLSLGEDAFLCRGRVDCQSVTGFQTNDLLLDYEMLWQNVNGTWLLADMAFA